MASAAPDRVDTMTTTRPFTPDSVIDLIGRTALLRLRAFGQDTPGVELYAKAEFQNPGGSVKDRAAKSILREAERSGRLHKGVTILDATSGNTGIAYAMIAAAFGYRIKLCMPANVTPERTRTLKAFGAELVLTDPMEGTDGAIREARRLFAGDPQRYYYADQYNNDANWRAHYEGTGPEIIEQTEGRITHFVAGLGTSGTFMGVGRRLREFSRDIRLISVQPDSPMHGVEGLKHMETAIRPGIYDDSLADEDARVSTERAYTYTRRLAAEEGMLVGVSSGAALAVSLELAARIGEGVVVMIFPDSGTRYLTERFWEAEGALMPELAHRRRSGNQASRHRNLPERMLRRADRVRRDDRRGLSAAQHHRRRAAAPVPDRSERLPARRGAGPGARRDARRFLSFASRSSGPPVGNGSGAGMAESDIHNRCGPRRPARRSALLAAARRSLRFRGDLKWHTAC